MPHLIGISKGLPLCEKRTRSGKISSTFTPSTMDPSLAITPLTITKRFERSSYQTIADNFKDGKVVTDPFDGGAMILEVLLPAGGSIFGGTRPVSSRASRADSREGGAGAIG